MPIVNVRRIKSRQSFAWIEGATPNLLSPLRRQSPKRSLCRRIRKIWPEAAISNDAGEYPSRDVFDDCFLSHQLKPHSPVKGL
jgi:hypothetical protein